MSAPRDEIVDIMVHDKVFGISADFERDRFRVEDGFQLEWCSRRGGVIVSRPGAPLRLFFPAASIKRAFFRG